MATRTAVVEREAPRAAEMAQPVAGVAFTWINGHSVRLAAGRPLAGRLGPQPPETGDRISLSSPFETRKNPKTGITPYVVSNRRVCHSTRLLRCAA